MILLAILILVLFFAGYLFLGKPKPAEKITWGVNFSQKHTELLGLDWKAAYLAILDDLKVRNLKVASYWDLIEPEEEEYNFEDLDWQIKEAEKRGTKILLVIGMKVPRWPECHEPHWVRNQKLNIKNQRLLEYIEKVVNRYKDSEAIWAWQVENELFFPFGECPKIDKNFLKKEVSLVKSLDFKNRPIVIADSGEFSLWITAAGFGDIVGTTLHRRVWFKEFKTRVSYPFKPIYYWRRAQIIKKFFNKKVICGELQAEPWCSVLLYDCSLEEQRKTMDLEQFQKNINFARKTGLDEFYLWGSEWWYWMKEKQNKPEIWDEARKLFINN